MGFVVGGFYVGINLMSFGFGLKIGVILIDYIVGFLIVMGRNKDVVL